MDAIEHGIDSKALRLQLDGSYFPKEVLCHLRERKGFIHLNGLSQVEIRIGKVAHIEVAEA